ncbi:MAG: hypothetical protein ACHQ15_05760 [Candidatus Limnocylindrales bacterium]
MTVTELPDSQRDRAVDDQIVDGDAATHLEALVRGPLELAPHEAPAEGVPIELVGEHLRLSGTLMLGLYRRLSDFANNHEGLFQLHDVTVLRRNGDPTSVTSSGIWVNPEEVTLIGQMADVDQPEATSHEYQRKRVSPVILVTTGHTITGEIHLVAGAVLSAFIESRSPMWIPMTDVRTRSLADRRVISRYGFALVNRRQIVAATALQRGMHFVRGTI